MNAASDPFVIRLRIAAPAEVVFDCFCDPRALLTWMGESAELEPHPGGLFALDVGQLKVRGRYEVVDRPRRLVFTWGQADSELFPPGASTVEVTLTPDNDATELTLIHRGLPGHEAPRHARGWAHFLARLARAAPELRPSPGPLS
jgi:uncharacterized protein YndB with AHSA1/START domain